jgi:hypothetical protein
MADVVNGFVVSTCGDYRPRGVQVEIGFRRTYETMVFRDTGKRCVIDGCHCGGLPEHDGREVDFEPYNNADDAMAGHARMVAKYRENVPS